MRGTFQEEGNGEVTLSLPRGARLLFASAENGTAQTYTVTTAVETFTGELPVCPQLCALDFSSDLLPERVTVTFSDAGSGADDWFAVGLPPGP